MSSFAQNGINYKAIIKDDVGNIVADQPVTVQFIIYKGEALTNNVYQESHPTTTDANGIVILNIGEGNTSDVFTDVTWGSDEHWLNVKVDIGSGLDNMGTTQFMAVPYALQAVKADNVTGLEKIIVESDTPNVFNTGWRLVGRIPAYYGPIGSNAVDLSYNFTSSEPYGATGNNSIAMGYRTTAPSYLETAIGRLNSDYTPASTTSWNSEDRLFVIGNGASNRNNAMTVLKNGKTGINTSSPRSIFEVLHQNGRPTSSDRTNAFSIRNYATSKSWQFYTHSLGYLELFSDGSHKGSFNPTSGVYAIVSDRRLKKDITPLDNGTLNKVMQLNPVSYLMKEQTDTKRNLGLISQEVQELFPSITHYVEESDILTLSYTELIPILIKALQEQQGIIEAQNSKLNTQDSKIDNLTAEMDQFKTLDQRVKQLENALKAIEQ
tara:strand:- start:4113 stop:5420 length:1308 start_codon:yes stop_codon:yes gene_type:complete